MKFIGSKRRIVKYIVPLMLEYRTSWDQYWVEPFVGGGNVIEWIDGNRIGGDIDKWVIQALTSIRDCVHELPLSNLEFTEEDYNNLKLSDDYKHKGYAGFSFSFGSKRLGGWARAKTDRRDYVRESYKTALVQSNRLQGVKLYNCGYDKLPIPSTSLIYCDPPYQDTYNYKIKFDHDKFWGWCRHKVREGYTVVVSEYNAPSDFRCVW